MACGRLHRGYIEPMLDDSNDCLESNLFNCMFLGGSRNGCSFTPLGKMSALYESRVATAKLSIGASFTQVHGTFCQRSRTDGLIRV